MCDHVRLLRMESHLSSTHFALILKPSGKGKLSKEMAPNLDFQCFPLSWESGDPEDRFTGFKEDGYLPETVLNFLVLLGWSPPQKKNVYFG